MKNEWIIGLIFLVAFLISLYGFLKWSKKHSNHPSDQVGGGGLSSEKDKENEHTNKTT